MSTDPFDVMFDYNDAAYDDLIKDAEKDSRVGDHTAMVTEIERGAWDDGQPRLKVKFNLITANNAAADWTFSPPPPPDVMATERTAWEDKKKRAIASTVTMVRQLAEHYSTTPGKLKVGDTFKVKTAKTRVDKEGKGGFIRIVAFLAKDHAVGQQAKSAGGSTPSVGF